MRTSVASGASTIVIIAMRPSKNPLKPARSFLMQNLQEQRVLNSRAVALALRFVRQRRPQLLVELGRRAREQHEHHQKIEMKDEIEQRRDDVEREQLDLDVEDRQRLRLAPAEACGGSS